MDISFKTSRLQELCSEQELMVKRLGTDTAKKLRQRLADLQACDSLHEASFIPGRVHEPCGDRRGQIAMDLHGGVRLIFVPDHDPMPRKPDGGLDRKSVTAIMVTEVGDYHD